MKPEIKNRMDAAMPVLGYHPLEVEQGTFEWHRMRLGVMTAGKASAIVAATTSATRRTYMAELCAEIATGAPSEEISGKAIAWGREHESSAVSTWEMINGQPLQRLSFIYGPSMRTGCSPDAMVSDTVGWETKCPFITTHHILTLADGVIKPEYKWQCQFSLWASDCDEWIFSSFDPRMKKNQLHSITVERSDKMQATLADAVPQFISDMDKMLKSIGCQFGDQWRNE